MQQMMPAPKPHINIMPRMQQKVECDDWACCVAGPMYFTIKYWPPGGQPGGGGRWLPIIPGATVPNSGLSSARISCGTGATGELPANWAKTPILEPSCKPASEQLLGVD